jgi:hypothetical protein
MRVIYVWCPRRDPLGPAALKHASRPVLAPYAL